MVTLWRRTAATALGAATLIFAHVARACPGCRAPAGQASTFYVLLAFIVLPWFVAGAVVLGLRKLSRMEALSRAAAPPPRTR